MFTFESPDFLSSPTFVDINSSSLGLVSGFVSLLSSESLVMTWFSLLSVESDSVISWFSSSLPSPKSSISSQLSFNSSSSSPSSKSSPYSSVKFSLSSSLFISSFESSSESSSSFGEVLTSICSKSTWDNKSSTGKSMLPDCISRYSSLSGFAKQLKANSSGSSIICIFSSYSMDWKSHFVLNENKELLPINSSKP